jgi:hypothetical protein
MLQYEAMNYPEKLILGFMKMKDHVVIENMF